MLVWKSSSQWTFLGSFSIFPSSPFPHAAIHLLFPAAWEEASQQRAEAAFNSSAAFSSVASPQVPGTGSFQTSNWCPWSCKSIPFSSPSCCPAVPLGFAEGERTDLWSEVLIAVGVIDVIQTVILYLAFSPMVSNQEMAKH